MQNASPRIQREDATVQAMIRLYCRTQNHARDGLLCAECAELAAYAGLRLEKCPFGEGKTTCAKCPVHCYKPEMRARIRQVMRVAGPRMLLRHPVLTLRHFMDGTRKQPLKKVRANR